MSEPYAHFTDEDLEREYSPSSMLDDDPMRYLAAYTDLSAEARNSPYLNADLSFGRGSSEVLDFFRSPSRQASPLHVFIHGGYWQELNHKQSSFMAPWFAEQGVAFAAINYSLAPKAAISTMIRECRSALHWLINRHELLGVDPDRISVSGHSAGAHLLAMLFSDDPSEENAERPRICSATLLSGIFDIRPIPRTYINDPLNLSDRQARTWSPMLLQPEFTCPVHVAVGEFDTPEFVRQSEGYADVLGKQGITVSHQVYSGLNHFDLPLNLDEIHRVTRDVGHPLY